jgi:uncharacterized protein YbbC (DUF1343 family)
VVFGTKEQCKRMLPGIVDGSEKSCFAVTEPNTGLNTTQLKTRAVRDGDHYIVNGQKTWTTLAQFADWIFCLVRTDTSVKQQEGITFLLIDMKTPGITVKPIIVLDRPNPITGYIIEGPLLDSSLANPEDPAPGRPGQAFAIWPIPLRHGMTIGELALYYNDVLKIRADLHVVPVQGWRRDVWFDLTGLPWVKPSPNMPSLQSAMLYPGLVAFESTNLSVGRGMPDAFQRVGAPWLNAAATVAILRDREIPGVRFYVESFTPVGPTDGKYPGQTIPGIRILVTNRSALQSVRVGATLLWAINKTAGRKLTIDSRGFDLRFGSPRVREALLRGEDPDVLIDREYKSAYAFRERTRQYLIYR